MIRWVKLAEELGYGSVWMAESRFRRDAFTPLAAFAAVTKHVRLGTAAINPFTRSPLLIAMSIASLDEVSGKRAVLGIGVSGKRWIEERYGEKFERPHKALIETVEVVRKLMAGETVTYEGKFVKMKDAKLGFKPPRTKIPVYLAPTGPKSLRLSRRVGDGVILNGFTSTEYVRNAVKIMNEASNAKRGSFQVAGAITACVGKSSSEALDAVRPIVASYLSIPEMFELRARVGDSVLRRPGIRRIIKKIHGRFRQNQPKKAVELVTDELASHLATVGNTRECGRRVKEYRESGLHIPIISPFGNEDQVQRTIRALAGQ